MAAIGLRYPGLTPEAMMTVDNREQYEMAISSTGTGSAIRWSRLAGDPSNAAVKPNTPITVSA